MKIQKNHGYLTIAVYAFCTALAIVVCYLILSNLSDFGKEVWNVISVFTPFIWGLSIAYVLNPLMKWQERRLVKIPWLQEHRKVKRAASVTGTMLIFFVLLYSFFSLVIPTVSQSVAHLIGNLNFYYTHLEEFIQNFCTTYLNGMLSLSQIHALTQDIISEVNKAGDLITEFLPQSVNLLISLTGKLTNIIIALIVSIYFLASKETFLAQMKKILYAFTNTAKSQYTLNLADKTNKIFNGYVSGSILDAIIVGCLCYLCLKIFHIEYAALISLLVGVTNVIPFFGPFLGAIPSAVLLLLVEPRQSLIFVVIIFILQQTDGNVIKPKVLGQTTGLASFWVIFSVTVGGSLFGIPGMFVGVPVFAVIYTLVKELVENRLRKKNLSPNTMDYREDLEDRFPIPDRLKQETKNNDPNSTQSKTKPKVFRKKSKSAETSEQRQENTPSETEATEHISETEKSTSEESKQTQCSESEQTEYEPR